MNMAAESRGKKKEGWQNRNRIIPMEIREDEERLFGTRWGKVRTDFVGEAGGKKGFLDKIKNNPKNARKRRVSLKEAGTRAKENRDKPVRQRKGMESDPGRKCFSINGNASAYRRKNKSFRYDTRGVKVE